MVNNHFFAIFSIVITTVMNKNDSKDCPDEFLYYTTKDGTQKGVILPENQFSSSLPELSIRPDCTYKIEIFANPLTDPLLKRSTVSVKMDITKIISNSVYYKFHLIDSPSSTQYQSVSFSIAAV